MSLVFVKGSDSFCINHNNIDLLPVRCLSLDGCPPAPEALCARVDSGAHSKTAASAKQHLVEEVGLACSVEPGDGDDTDGPGYAFEEGCGFGCQHVFYVKGMVYCLSSGPQR